MDTLLPHRILSVDHLLSETPLPRKASEKKHKKSLFYHTAPSLFGRNFPLRRRSITQSAQAPQTTSGSHEKTVPSERIDAHPLEKDSYCQHSRHRETDTPKGRLRLWGSAKGTAYEERIAFCAGGTNAQAGAGLEAAEALERKPSGKCGTTRSRQSLVPMQFLPTSGFLGRSREKKFV